MDPPALTGDDGLLHLRPGPALDLTRLPELWQPARRRPLDSGVGRYRPQPRDGIPRSPAEKQLCCLLNATWCPLGRLAFLSLRHGRGQQNRLIDAWVAHHAPTLSLAADPDPQAPQAAWVAAYLLADGRTRSSTATLGRLLAGATAHLPRAQQLPAAAALLGQALELGTLALQADRGAGHCGHAALATRLTHLQARLLGQPHPKDTMWPKATTALALATGVRIVDAAQQLESQWLQVLPRCWRHFVSLGDGRPAEQSGLDADLLEGLGLSLPSPCAHPVAGPDLAGAWGQVVVDFVDFERRRQPGNVRGGWSPRLALLAVRTLQRHGLDLPIDAARALEQAPPSAFDPVRCPPAVAAGLRQSALEVCMAAPAQPIRSAARL